MKRYTFGLITSLALAGVVATAQATTPPPGQQTPPPGQQQTPPQTPRNTQDKGQEVTLTGCLIQGSGPSVFIIDEAKRSADDKNEKAMSYILAEDPSAKNLDFRTNLNHKVRIVGMLDNRSGAAMGAGSAGAGGVGTGAGTTGAAAGQAGRQDEKNMRKFTAKSVQVLSDSCNSFLVR